VHIVKLVLDTDVIVAAMRSPTGASAALLLEVLNGRIVLMANVALVIEYEATCSREEHVVAAGLNRTQLGVFIDAVTALITPVETHFLWRPQLRDPGDEMVLEAAVNGGAQAIVTFNQRDFGVAPTRFGVDVMLPRDALQKVKRIKG
jgi:putative PIN family toxin of toxin-antitoxin system